MINLKHQSLILLKKCLQEYSPSLIVVVENPCISEYTAEFYNQLRQIVGDEFVSKGLKENSEPNEYGLLLEKLIDEIGRLFLYQ